MPETRAEAEEVERSFLPATLTVGMSLSLPCLEEGIPRAGGMGWAAGRFA